MSSPVETVGLVGESGCGKSVTALAIMGLLPKAGVRVGGRVLFDGQSLLDMPEESLRDLRGREVAMVFQDPMTSLNPVITIGLQVTEVLRRHRAMNETQARAEAQQLLRRVGIPDPGRRLRDYPHQLSGGMRQRALIAMALACRPRLLIADEPTTALDVTIQAQILGLLRELVEETGTALVMITHDLGVIAGLCESVHVMYSGRIVESAPRHRIFAEPHHPYTGGLLASVPRLDTPRGVALEPIPGSPGDVLPWATGCAFAPRCARCDERCTNVAPDLVTHRSVGSGERARRPMPPSARGDQHRRAVPGMSTQSSGPDSGAGEPPLLRVRDLAVHFPIKRGLLLDRTVGHVKAVDGVSFDLARGSTYGLVGESGCGKSTTGRAVLRLLEPTRGSVIFDGVDLAVLDGEPLRRMRRRMQMVFQDPMACLDPRQSVESILSEPMRAHGTPDDAAARARRVRELLDVVGLAHSSLSRYPHEFSGGQRQRIGIARAIALNPDLVIADEPVSALDVSVQAQVINLLEELQERFDLTYLVIAHDLAVVRHISEVIGVMYLGTLVEQGGSEQVCADPLHPYTIALLSAVPIPDPVVEDGRERILLTGDLPSPADPPSGCPFHTRCPHAVPDPCTTRRPALREVSPGRRVACHLVEQIHGGRPVQPPSASGSMLSVTPGDGDGPDGEGTPRSAPSGA